MNKHLTGGSFKLMILNVESILIHQFYQKDIYLNNAFELYKNVNIRGCWAAK